MSYGHRVHRAEPTCLSTPRRPHRLRPLRMLFTCTNANQAATCTYNTRPRDNPHHIGNHSSHQGVTIHRPRTLRSSIIYHNISVRLSYTNQHFSHHCLEWILDLFFGSCVKKCQQAFPVLLPGKIGWLPFENRWLDTLMRLCNLTPLLKQNYHFLFLSILFEGY
jgi:hypothetical protein